MLNLTMAGLLASPGPGLLKRSSRHHDCHVIPSEAKESLNGAGIGAVMDDTAAGTVPDSHRIPY